MSDAIRYAWLANQPNAQARILDPSDLAAALALEAPRLPAGAKIAIALPPGTAPDLGPCWDVQEVLAHPDTGDVLIRATRTIAAPAEPAPRKRRAE